MPREKGLAELWDQVRTVCSQVTMGPWARHFSPNHREGAGLGDPRSLCGRHVSSLGLGRWSPAVRPSSLLFSAGGPVRLHTP